MLGGNSASSGSSVIRESIAAHILSGRFVRICQSMWLRVAIIVNAAERNRSGTSSWNRSPVSQTKHVGRVRFHGTDGIHVPRRSIFSMLYSTLLKSLPNRL